MLQQGQVHAGRLWLAFQNRSPNFLCSPVDDAGHDERQAVAGVLRVSPGFTRKSTVRNGKSADFGQFLRQFVLSELNSPSNWHGSKPLSAIRDAFRTI
jgi:hypothetical protein